MRMSTQKKSESVSATNLSAAKKTAVLSEKSSRTFPPSFWYGLLALAMVLSVGLGYRYSASLGAGALPVGVAEVQAAEPQGDEVTHPVSEFDDGLARHYSLKAPGGITVRYFLLKSKDGSIRAAFDACDVCWRAGKGYVQEGDNMVCKNCGRRFASVQVGQVRGGCNPGPLAMSVRGDKVHIKKADIYEGQHYFDLKR
jgi:uncharacterized membrane protein